MEGTGRFFAGWTCYAGAAASTYMALDRVLNYTKGNGILALDARHAYVGGDAYNYIINGTHASALMLGAVMFAILGSYALLSRRLDAFEPATTPTPPTPTT